MAAQRERKCQYLASEARRRFQNASFKNLSEAYADLTSFFQNQGVRLHRCGGVVFCSHRYREARRKGEVIRKTVKKCEESCTFQIRFKAKHYKTDKDGCPVFIGKGANRAPDFDREVYIPERESNRWIHRCIKSSFVSSKSDAFRLSDLTEYQWKVLASCEEHYEVIKSRLNDFSNNSMVVTSSVIFNARVKARSYKLSGKVPDFSGKINANEKEAYSWARASFLKDYLVGKEFFLTKQALGAFKKELPGFQYRIFKNEEGCPVGVIIQTEFMRKAFFRWGQVVFMDAMGTRINDCSWPYFAVTVIDSEGKCWAVLEGVYYGEKLEFYRKLLACLKEWCPSVIVLTIFSDLFLEKGFSKTTVYPHSINLPDEWHLIFRTWPQHFGGSYHGEMEQILSAFIRCDDEAKLTEKADAVRKYFRGHPEKEYIEKFIEAPSYHTRAFKNKHFTLGYYGQTASESNHSGIKSIMALSPADRVKLPLMFQKLMLRWDRKVKVDNLTLFKERGQARLRAGLTKVKIIREIEENFASALSSKLVVQYKLSLAWRFIGLDANGCIQMQHTNGKIRTFAKDGRCECSFVKTMRAQCRHEFGYHKKLMKDLIHPRWDSFDSYFELPEIPVPTKTPTSAPTCETRGAEVEGKEGENSDYVEDSDMDVHGLDSDEEELGAAQDATLPSTWNATKIQKQVLMPLLFQMQRLKNEDITAVAVKLMQIKTLLETRSASHIKDTVVTYGLESLLRDPGDKRPLGIENVNRPEPTGRLRSRFEGKNKKRKLGSGKEKQGCKLCGLKHATYIKSCPKINALNITPLSATVFEEDLTKLTLLNMVPLEDTEVDGFFSLSQVKVSRHVLILEFVEDEKVMCTAYEQGCIHSRGYCGLQNFITWASEKATRKKILYIENAISEHYRAISGKENECCTSTAAKSKKIIIRVGEKHILNNNK